MPISISNFFHIKAFDINFFNLNTLDSINLNQFIITNLHYIPFLQQLSLVINLNNLTNLDDVRIYKSVCFLKLLGLREPFLFRRFELRRHLNDKFYYSFKVAIKGALMFRILERIFEILKNVEEIHVRMGLVFTTLTAYKGFYIKLSDFKGLDALYSNTEFLFFRWKQPLYIYIVMSRPLFRKYFRVYLNSFGFLY